SVLESLFRFSSTGMSTFRVLYNLEVLSSKLMPLSQDEMARDCARSFCEGFVQAGGLNLVVGVMERDTLPMDTDYETRQDIYSICLQLARFLLVGLPLDNNFPDDIAMETNEGRPSPSSRPARTAQHLRSNTTTSPSTPSSSSSSSQSSSDRASIRIDDVHPAARAAIQTMESCDFASAVSCLVRVSWAAAAGRLDLSGTTPLSDPGVIYMRGAMGGGRRSRQSSTGSTGSSGSELGDPSAVLQAGVCVRQLAVAPKDARVSIEALSLLVTCLQLRSSLIGAFYTVPCVSDFIIDILLCSPSEEVRRAACDELYALSCTSCPTMGGGVGDDASQGQKPLLFLLRVILQARLPLWTPAGTLRGHHQRLLAQCKEYFDLRCRLLEDMTDTDMKMLEVSPAAMLEDEITWLDNYEPPAALWCHSGTSLLAGHLRLINTLLMLSTQDKDQIGPHLIRQLLETFLFPAAKIIETTQKEEAAGPPSQHNFNPRCCSQESRLAACEVLVTLADSSLRNLQLLCSELLSLHPPSGAVT
uniref:Uncharacterized protein n=1 Tax=Petromyzon marinus TaxID=7757 RepID=S4RRQ4_PETMA